MRKRIVINENGDEIEEIIDDPNDRHISRNRSGDETGKRKEKLQKIIDKFNAKNV